MNVRVKTITVIIVITVLSLIITVYSEDANPIIVNLPSDSFPVIKAELAEQQLLGKVAKELGKVSDEVRKFLERILRVAKTIFKDWILKDDDGSEATEATTE